MSETAFSLYKNYFMKNYNLFQFEILSWNSFATSVSIHFWSHIHSKPEKYFNYTHQGELVKIISLAKMAYISINKNHCAMKLRNLSKKAGNFTREDAKTLWFLWTSYIMMFLYEKANYAFCTLEIKCADKNSSTLSSSLGHYRKVFSCYIRIHCT